MLPILDVQMSPIPIVWGMGSLLILILFFVIVPIVGIVLIVGDGHLSRKYKLAWSLLMVSCNVLSLLCFLMKKNRMIIVHSKGTIVPLLKFKYERVKSLC